MRRLKPSTMDQAGSLRERLVDDGYLYLPGLLEPSGLLALQEELRRVLVGAGWLAERTGLAMPRCRSDSFTAVYPAVQRIEAAHRLAHHSRIDALMADLLDGPVFCHPPKVIRLVPPTAPESRFSIRSHQDFSVLQLSADVLTCWIPLVQCTSACQGLRILPGSHLRGYLRPNPALGGSRPIYLDVLPDDPNWAIADYRIGDVVVFHSLTVHAGGPNTSGLLRMSIDVRYQRTDEPLFSDFLHPHGWPRTPDWASLCEGWETTRWHQVPPEVPIVASPAEISYELPVPRSRLLERYRAPVK